MSQLRPDFSVQEPNDEYVKNNKNSHPHANPSILPTDLTQPLDIYSDWVDACEEVAKTEAAASAPTQPNSAYRRPPPPASRPGEGIVPGDKYTDEDDGFIDDEDADGEAEFAD